MKKFSLQIIVALIALLLMAFTCDKKDEGPLEPATTGAIAGNVIEYGNNKPVENAKVYSTPATEVIATGEYGSYRINTVKPGTYTVFCVKNGYDTLQSSVTVVAGSTARADFILQLTDTLKSNKYGRISGIVKNSKDDSFVKNVLIKTTPSTMQVMTNDKGEFLIDKVLPGTYKINASKNGYETTETSINVIAGYTASAHIHISTIDIISEINNGIITGKITDGAEGKGISGAVISTTPSASSVTSDADGNYRIEKLSPGEFTITATKSGYTSATTKVVVKTGLTTRADLVLLKANGIIKGTVVGTDNYPIAGVQIKTDPGTAIVTTDANGQFTLDNIAPGKYKLLASKQDYIDFTTDIVVTAGNITKADFILKVIGSN